MGMVSGCQCSDRLCLWGNVRKAQRKASSSVQPLSRVRLSVTPMDSGTPGLPVHCQLPELAQTRVHQVGDAIQPSHPLLFPSPPALNLFQHQGLFQ